MSETLWIIFFGAVFTYLTRVGGHLVLSRFERIPARLEAALNAVPAAVLTTLIAPAAMSAGWPELAGLAVAGVLSLRAGMLVAFCGGMLALILLRQVAG